MPWADNFFRDYEYPKIWWRGSTFYHTQQRPVNMPQRVLTGPELGRYNRHRPGSDPDKAGYGMFTG